MTTAAAFAVYMFAGLAAGLLSGLFGLGGGLTIVPALAVALPLQGVVSGHVMHLAIGTSLSVMFLSALYTSFLRSRRGDLDWPLVARLLPPVLVGTAAGAIVGGRLPDLALRVFFIGFVAYMIARALRRQFAQPARSESGASSAVTPVVPSARSRWFSGAATGVTGALLGAGAAIITVPYLQSAGYRIQSASAVAAALSAVIGFGAGVGYLIGGLSVPGLPDAAIGYLYIPAFVGMAAGALLGSPLGVYISHRMAEPAQFWLFLSYLGVVLAVMAWPG